MSRTFKHQAKYDQKVYWEQYSRWCRMKPIIEDNEIVGWERTPIESIPPEPHPWYWHGIETRRAKWYHKHSNRECRRNAKHMIKLGNYVEAEYLKPRNVDWEIW